MCPRHAKRSATPAARRTPLLWLLLALIAALFAASPALATAADESGGETPSRTIETWLAVGPEPLALPAFHDEESDFELATLLEASSLDPSRLEPQEGARAGLGFAADASWRLLAAEEGALALEAEGPARAWLATWISTPSFFEGSLKLESKHPLRAHLGRRALGAAGEHELALPAGKYKLLVELIHDPEQEAPFTLEARLAGERVDELSLGRSPSRPLDIPTLLDGPDIGELRLSADGLVLALRRRAPAVPAEGREEWVEFVDAESGELLTRTSSALTGFAWSPKGREYAWIEREEGKATLWVASWDDAASARPLLRDVENLRSFTWSADGASLFFTVASEAKKTPIEEEGLVRVRSLADRWRSYRDTTRVEQVLIEDGTRRRITAGPLSTTLLDVAPNGERILVARSRYDRPTRPYSETEVFEIELATLSARRLFSEPFGVSARYAPSGEGLVVLAGPSAFEQVGTALEEGRIPNDYDQQVFLYDLSSGALDPISKTFDPSILEARFDGEGQLLLRAEVGERVVVYRFDEAERSFEPLDFGFDVVHELEPARGAPRVAARGSSAATPPSVVVMDLASGETRGVSLGEPDPYEHVEFGRVESFDFVSSVGNTITGRVHFPPDFDESKRYPAIVYYYAGTNPVGRSFGGRYPKNLWAAHGYLVYVLQPSGATGFGQEFAARHVNDWGRTTVGEIIEGTQALLEAHPYVDPERLGCIGASYGGFTTMLLITRTDMFSAAVSHAGISSLSSYWGEGWWGWLYSAVATAGSYPWNREDLYVDQSALFDADKINTPLLLLHGTADTNVPIGESEQMFTALELLDREVEYVRVEGEDHQIFQYPKRKRWMETILAFFDRELKDDATWWNYLYPASEGAEE